MHKRTLFLDRDGVINRQIIGGYVTSKDEFEFLPGVKDALAKLALRYDYIFIVTNQQGIGKGVFSENDLNEIHAQMLNEIAAAGGRIDKIYFCAELEAAHSPYRKPSPGMGLKAKADFPDLYLDAALMVGDTLSDMEFGRNLGVKTVYLHNAKEIPVAVNTIADAIFCDLADFAENYTI